MSDHKIHKSYYEILEVNPSASLEVIRTAYIRAKQTYSSNSPKLYSIFSKKEAKQLLTLIEEAYLILSHQAKRSDYDLSQQAQHQGASVPLIKAPPSPKAQSIAGESLPFILESSDMPDGFICSKFGVYEVLPEMEEQITNGSAFDGSFIQKVRMYKKINLEQMSRETRINRAYLASIESNDFESLPAAVFVRGFIIQIAKALGLNPEKVAKSYMMFFKQGYVG